MWQCIFLVLMTSMATAKHVRIVSFKLRFPPFPGFRLSFTGLTSSSGCLTLFTFDKDPRPVFGVAKIHHLRASPFRGLSPLTTGICHHHAMEIPGGRIF